MRRLHLTAEDIADLLAGGTINAMVEDGEELAVSADQPSGAAVVEAEPEVKAWTLTEDADTGSLTTQCPHCQAVGTVEEVDTAMRWNRLSIADDGRTAVAYTGDTGDWEGEGWICTSCLSRDLSQPEGFEITDWL